LLVRRVPAFSSWAVGGFALASALLALVCHAVFEPPARISPADWLKLALLGLGPMGAAFYLWDVAMKRGDPRVVGVLAYATPLLSTLMLTSTTGRPWSWTLGLSALLVAGSALAVARAGNAVRG
jgi:drug/metabolite transporter (DMT)-like permease